MSSKPMQVVEGLAAASGVAIGRAVCIGGSRLEVLRLPLEAEDVPGEVERLRLAARQAAEDLQRTRDRAENQLGHELAAIFDAHLLVLGDRTFLGAIEERIRKELVNAEWAVHEISEELQSRFEKFEVEHLRERSDDVRDVAQHLLHSLAGIDHHELSELGHGVVIVADDLTPSEAVRLARQQVIGFALERGGQTSHTTIIARSLQIPLVSGLAGVTQRVTDADPVVVDGRRGRLILHPTEATLARYRAIQERLAERQEELGRIRALPSITRDGAAIDLLANIDLPEEIDDAVRYGATGVGLYRSEFLFIEKSPELPSEEDHYQVYRELLQKMHPYPVVVRTFDLGGRKLAREVLDTREENPVLGLRGVRLTLARPEVFRSQLRALHRAAHGGRLRVLLPLVSSVDEVRQFRKLSEQVAAELKRDGVTHAERLHLGAMIEVPSAALIAQQLAREVEFFSIGTNDLIQYAMAVDRGNDHVSYLYQPLHPAILRMIRFAVEAAREAQIPVTLCGEVAAEARFTPLLAGIGLRSLSLTPRLIPEIKELVLRLKIADWKELGERCASMSTASEVEQALRERLGEVGALPGAEAER